MKRASIIECLQKLSKLNLRIDILSSDGGDQVAQDIQMHIRENLIEIFEVVTDLAKNEMLIQASGRGKG